ncbi:MAG: HAMP domain-containing histidine kinase [Myxococcales bacterium]|nr:HAMP domain-containing histidine kinase [Myxococcales bacterium]
MNGLSAPLPPSDGCELIRVSLHDLLSEEEVALLRAASEVGCELSLLDREGRAVVGDQPPSSVFDAMTTGSPQAFESNGCEYLGVAYFHDGDELCRIICKLQASAESRARSLRSAHYLIRLAETLLHSAVQRTMMTRLHSLQVEEAHLELQQKSQRLDQAVARMKDSERIKASFLATVSHELRTPLTSVIGYTEMVIEGLAGPISDEQREYLSTILAKSDQLHQLISKLLDVSRLEVSSVQLCRTSVDLRGLLQDVIRSMAPQLRRKRTRLQLSVAEDLPQLQADRDKLRQVLQNLIGNAIKFTRDEGEVTVSAALAVSESGEARVLLSVSDNGIGIPSHLHDKVFDAFYQVDSSSTRQHEGSGLGLLLVRRYINAHGGKVWIEDHPTGGTTFRISLPSS